jgi:hypothetical protein
MFVTADMLIDVTADSVSGYKADSEKKRYDLEPVSRRGFAPRKETLYA